MQVEVAVGGWGDVRLRRRVSGLGICLVSGEEMEGEVRMSAGTPAEPTWWVIVSSWRQGMGEGGRVGQAGEMGRLPHTEPKAPGDT